MCQVLNPVDPFMSQILLLCKCLVKFGTRKLLFAYVDHFMCLQVFTQVVPFMSAQMIFLFKCLVTFGAGKRHLSCVNPFMLAQIISLCKCLVTFRAGKRHLSCVDHFMFPHIIFYVNVLPQLE